MELKIVRTILKMLKSNIESIKLKEQQQTICITQENKNKDQPKQHTLKEIA